MGAKSSELGDIAHLYSLANEGGHSNSLITGFHDAREAKELLGRVCVCLCDPWSMDFSIAIKEVVSLWERGKS